MFVIDRRFSCVEIWRRISGYILGLHIQVKIKFKKNCELRKLAKIAY